MGRHKKEVRLNKVIGFKVTEEQYNLIKSLPKEDKDKFYSKLKELTDKYTGLLLSQNKISVNQNNEDEISVNQNNEDEISVNQNKISVNQNNELTEDAISELIEEETPSYDKKSIKNTIRRIREKQLNPSPAQLAMQEFQKQEQKKYNGVNVLFEGSCEL